MRLAEGQVRRLLADRAEDPARDARELGSRGSRAGDECDARDGQARHPPAAGSLRGYPRLTARSAFSDLSEPALEEDTLGIVRRQCEGLAVRRLGLGPAFEPAEELRP